jgi:hypothetical protein
MNIELIIAGQFIVIIILALTILGMWLTKNECKYNCQPNDKPDLTPTQLTPDICTCGTTYDFDGIPQRKSCKKHSIR